MKKIIFIWLIIVFCSSVYSQTLQWRALPSAPTNNIKLDDCFFINANTGWVISGQSLTGRIFKTTNGGYNWVQQFAANGYYRCIGFADSLRGWIGDLEANKVLQTTNGGSSWSAYTLPSPSASGMCGLSVVNKDVVYGCGRNAGPAYFFKTTNGGTNWTAQNMSAYAYMLIDCHFFNKDTGYVVGGAGTTYFTDIKPVILYTTNGGTNWQTMFTGNLTSQWFWKIYNINKDTIYAAIESWRFTDTVSYAKSTNGGINWQVHNFEIDSIKYHAQSVIFLKNGLGWVGGYSCCSPSVTNGFTYSTTNNGASWTEENWGFNINRFRFVNDSLAYAVGKTVYKYSNDNVGINIISQEIPTDYKLYQNYPNPFNPNTKIKFSLPKIANVNLKVYNINGKEIADLVSQRLTAGVYEVDFNASVLSSGVYYYKLTVGSYSETRKMLLVK